MSRSIVKNGNNNYIVENYNSYRTDEMAVMLTSEKKTMESVSMMVVAREIFQDILDMENSIELYRKELALRYDFTLGAFYNLFATNALYKINLDDFL